MLQRRAYVWFALSLCFVLATQGASMRSGQTSGISIDWPSYNNDLHSDRFAAIAQMTPANVNRLHVICAAQLGGPANLQTGPIVVGGVLYVTRWNQTFALDAATCKPLWSYLYLGSTAHQQTRGIAYANGKLFRAFVNGHVIAINATTHALMWDQQILATHSFESISAAPITWNGLVVIGTANGDSGEVCHVVALDQTSGRVVWSQQTVPDLGAPAAQTWKGAAHIGGGATWSSFTVDGSTGKLYVPVGNPGPDFDDRDRLGANLYTDSVLELNAATGAFMRAMQFEPQDQHDWDQGATPAVVTLANGSKVALVAGKDGYLRSVDLSTFAQRWRTPVTTIANAAAPIVPAGTHFCPWGGVLWNGPAYSPATGLVYVNAIDWCTTVDREASATPKPWVPGQLWTGSTNYFGTTDAARSGWLSAIDAATGTLVWKYHSSQPLIAGVTPTAGGVVFTADLLGNVLAFNAATGTLLTSVATNLPVGGGVVSYEVAGAQYVAVAAGISSGSFLTPKVNSTVIVLGL